MCYNASTLFRIWKLCELNANTNPKMHPIGMVILKNIGCLIEDTEKSQFLKSAVVYIGSKISTLL